MKILIICRSVKDGLTKNSALGYACTECREPIQLSPAGQLQLKVKGLNHVELLCCKCGFEKSEEAYKAGNLAGIGVSDAALEQLRRMKAEGKI